MKRITHRVGFAKAAFAAMALLAIVLIAGCSKEKAPFEDLGVSDKTVPEDQLCTLEIGGGLMVIDFNGIRKAWGYTKGEGSDNYATIKIPAGSHAFKVYFGKVYEGMNYSVGDLSISHNFTAGRTYRLLAQLHKENGDVLEAWMPKDLPGIKTVSLTIVEK